MTYDEIVKKMNDLRLDHLRSALDRAVTDEAVALRQLEPGRKQTQRFLQNTEQQAKDYFAEDITKFMDMAGQDQITPDQVLNHRRLATAWAIAQKLKGSTYNCLCGQTLTTGEQVVVYDHELQHHLQCTRYGCTLGHTLLLVNYVIQKEEAHV